jgi:hypothetical protein
MGSGRLSSAAHGLSDASGAAASLRSASANRTKPGRMAGLRCFRVMPLPEAHGAIALSVGRLLPQRLRLSRRVWDAGE